MTLTVGAVSAPVPFVENDNDCLNANMEIRREMIRLINQIRQEKSREEPPIDKSLMNAAQDVTSQCVTEHWPYDHKALVRHE